MRGTVLLGVILLIAGLAGLAWPVISYTTTEKVVDIGPVEVTAEREKRVPVPPVVGGLAAIAGVVIIVAGSRKAVTRRLRAAGLLAPKGEIGSMRVRPWRIGGRRARGDGARRRRRAVALLNTEWASRRVAREVEALLESRFDGRVEVESLSMSLFPRVAVTGTNLRVSREGEASPMLEIARFEVSGTPLELLRRSFSRVDMDGLQIYITRGRGQAKAMGGNLRNVREIRFGDVRVRNGRLVILPDDPQKLPLEFGLEEITLSDFSFDRSTAFAARLVNPRPRALIQTEGRFGPWATASPRATPVSGVYLFNDGELDAIKGLGGHLTSSGKFERRARAHRRRGHDHQPRLPARSRPASRCRSAPPSRRPWTAPAATYCSTTSMRRSASRASAPTARWRPRRASRGAP